jgi:hypothetical protein
MVKRTPRWWRQPFPHAPQCLEEVERWVLSWGTHATVIKPDLLATRVSKIIRELIKRYPGGVILLFLDLPHQIAHLIGHLIDPVSLPSEVPSGQHENSPAFQRRGTCGRAVSPERTADCARKCRIPRNYCARRPDPWPKLCSKSGYQVTKKKIVVAIAAAGTMAVAVLLVVPFGTPGPSQLTCNCLHEQP